MTYIYNSIIIIASAIVLSNCQNSVSEPKEGVKTGNSWESIFNGVNLDNWNVKIKGHPLGVNWNDTFIVVDSAIRVNYNSYTDFNSSFGHIFYKNSYSNYKLKLNYRFIGAQLSGGEKWAIKNSGVMIHCQSPESMELNQDFPVSLEVQLLGGITKGEKRSTGNLCTPGTHVVMDNELVKAHCINSNSDTYYDDEWVELEVVVWNDSIVSHFINGKKVIEYSKPIIGGEYNRLIRQGFIPIKKWLYLFAK